MSASLADMFPAPHLRCKVTARGMTYQVWATGVHVATFKSMIRAHQALDRIVRAQSV